MDEERKEIEANIRACIVSSKGPLSLGDLQRDYDTLVGQPIPFKKFNCRDLEHFLQSFSSLRLCGSGRNAMIAAATDESSKHVASLISRQKSSGPKKRSNYHPPRQRGNFQPRPHYQPNRYTNSTFAATKTNYPRFRNDDVENRKTYEPSYARRGNYNSSRGGYHGVNMAPRFQHKKYDEGEADKTPLFVKIEDENRRVSYRDTSDTAQYPPSSKEITQKKSGFTVPPRFQKPKMIEKERSSPQSFIQHAAPMKEDVQPLLDSNADDKLEQRMFPYGPSHLVAMVGAKIQTEQVHHPEQLLEDISLTGVKNLTILPAAVNEPEPELMHVPDPDVFYIPRNVALLESYCLSRGLPVPAYDVVSRRPNNGPTKIYTALVHVYQTSGSIGTKVEKYSSYPDEPGDDETAKGYAAKKALTSLKKIEKQQEELLDRYKSQKITEMPVIFDRINEIVADSLTGLFAKSVEDTYRDKYQELLPDDWINLISSCPTIDVEPVSNSFIISPRTISVDNTVGSSLPVIEVPPLKLPTDEFWNVYVTCASATDDVWFRLIGEDYDLKLQELTEKMEEYYRLNGSKEIALSIEPGHYYAALIPSIDSILRVYVREVIEENQEASAWLIDHGDFENLPFHTLYHLIPEFSHLPRQAVPCILEGLEEFKDDEYSQKILATSDYVIGQTLVAKVLKRNEENNVVNVVLFDTSGDDDVNINEKLFDSFLQLQQASSLPHDNKPKGVYVSHVSPKGEVYIQMPSPLYDRLSSVILSLTEEELTLNKVTGFKQVLLNKIYLAKFKKDHCWYRAVVLNAPSPINNKIRIQFIDFGNIETVCIEDLVDISNLPPILSTLHHLAIQVTLHNLPTNKLSPMDIARLNSLLLDEEKIVHIKTVDRQKEPAVVDMFINYEDQLASISSVIEKLRSLTNDTNAQNLGSGQILQMPTFDKENCHAAMVVLAANPSNFSFQLSNQRMELEKLMKRMQAFYASLSLPVVTEVSIGKAYACLYPADKAWYRVVVTGDIGSQVSIALCDFGDFFMVPKANLRQLASDFAETPAMAIRARLAGVTPKHRDWEIEDTLRFQQLVLDKVLSAQIVDVENNFVDPLDTRVVLKLFDAEKEEYISDILIAEDRAIRQ